MPQFAFRARNPEGGLVEGVLDCADRAVAIRQIQHQRWIPINIEPVVAVTSKHGGDDGTGRTDHG
jgi:type II secretory pathway component PulF